MGKIEGCNRKRDSLLEGFGAVRPTDHRYYLALRVIKYEFEATWPRRKVKRF